jgi:hypothetical protein
MVKAEADKLKLSQEISYANLIRYVPDVLEIYRARLAANTEIKFKTKHVAAHELAVIFRQRAGIIQGDAPVSMNLFHRDQFTIGEFASILAPGIGFELQPFTSGQRKFFRLANRDALQIFERNRSDAVVGFNQQMFIGYAA